MLSLGKFVKVAALILLALTWFSGVEVSQNITITKVAGIIVAAIWLLCKLGEWAITRKTLPVSKRNGLLILLMILFISLSLASTAFARDPSLSITRLQTLFMLFGMVIIYYDQFRTERDLQIAYKVLTYSGILASVLLIIQYFSGISFPGTPETHILQGSIRSIGVAWDPNFAALNIVVAFPLVYYMIKTYHSTTIKTMLSLGLLAIITAVFTTFSRGGIISLFAVILLILLTERYRARKFVAMGMILPILFYFLPVGKLAARIESVPAFFVNLHNSSNLALNYASIWQRYNALISGWRMFTDNFFTGVGWGNFPVRSLEYGALGHMDAHNTYLSIMGELGFLGIVIFLGIIFLAWHNLNLAHRYCHNNENKALIRGLKVGLLSFLFSALFLSAQVASILWILLAFSAISYKVTRKQGCKGGIRGAGR